jgi:phytoene synthase
MPQLFPEQRWEADIAACRAMLRHGSRSFFAASFLLPRTVREPASALYAFCRLADDAVDVDAASAGAIDRLRAGLERAYAGRPRAHPVERAFAETVSRFAIPRDLPEALIDGLAWDAEGRRYEDLAALHAYSARVAGTVGAMMALLMGVRAPALLARACDLGVAMQLTNIARDVGEDARAGRLYLPLRWLEQAGIDGDAWLAKPKFTEILGEVVARVLHAANELYRRADSGIAALPRSCRPGIRAARLLYAEIGNELARSGFDSISRRTVVPVARKLDVIARALALPPGDSRQEAACLPETAFLVAAVTAAAPRPTPTGGAARWWDFQAQAIWVINLFDQLERRHRFSGARALESEA